MKQLRRRVLVGALLAAPSSLLRAAPGAGTAPLEPIDLPASDGQPALADRPAARLTYIDFWASWCAPCRLSFPWMNAARAAFAAADLRIVAINVDRRRSDADRFLAQQPARFAFAFDAVGRSAETLSIPTMPTSLLVARDRRVLWWHRGFVPADEKRLDALLREALT